MLMRFPRRSTCDEQWRADRESLHLAYQDSAHRAMYEAAERHRAELKDVREAAHKKGYEEGLAAAGRARWHEGYDQGYTDGYAAGRNRQASVKDEPSGCTECAPPADSPDSYFPKET